MNLNDEHDRLRKRTKELEREHHEVEQSSSRAEHDAHMEHLRDNRQQLEEKIARDQAEQLRRNSLKKSENTGQK